MNDVTEHDVCLQKSNGIQFDFESLIFYFINMQHF